MVHEQVEQIFSDILSNRQASNFIALLRDKFITDMEKEPENLSDEQIRYLVLARNYNRINIRVAEYNRRVDLDDDIRPKDKPANKVDADKIDLYIMAYLNIDSLDISLWRSASEFFAFVLTALYDAIVADTELMLWRNASTKSSASIERMFAIKAKRPEYRENSLGRADAVTRINITLNDKLLSINSDTNKIDAPSLPSSQDRVVKADNDIDLDLADLDI